MVREEEFVVDHMEEDIELRPRGFMGFDGGVSQPVRGNPVRDGLLWFLPVDEKPIRMRVKLYCNALTFEPADDPSAVEKVCLAPFSLVRNCRFSNAAKESCDNFKIFKLHLFAHNITYYFGTEFDGSSNSEQLADRDRTTWVLDISHAIRLVTQSLFPHG